MAYYKSFDVADKDAYVEFFHKHGFVVINDVLNSEECLNSCNEVWDYLERNGTISRDDPATWGNEYWPQEICRNGGFMGKFPYWKRMRKLDESYVNKQPHAWRNRENPLIYEVFRNLIGTKRLWVSIDRYGVMRPAKIKGTDIINSEEKQIIDKEEWKTKKDWLHWDLSPFHGGTSAAGFAPSSKMNRSELAKDYGSIRLQGLVTMVDCPEENGGFHCVPGFHGKRFQEWGDAMRETYGQESEIATRNFIEVPCDDPMRSETLRIPMRAGSLLVWNSQLPHGNFPTSGENFRIVQYIKMIPVDDPREFTPAMKIGKFSMEEWFPTDYQPSQLGKMLYGIEDWKNDQLDKN